MGLQLEKTPFCLSPRFSSPQALQSLHLMLSHLLRANIFKHLVHLFMSHGDLAPMLIFEVCDYCWILDGTHAFLIATSL